MASTLRTTCVDVLCLRFALIPNAEKLRNFFFLSRGNKSPLRFGPGTAADLRNTRVEEKAKEKKKKKKKITGVLSSVNRVVRGEAAF